MVPVVQAGYSIEFEETEGIVSIAVADEYQHYGSEEEETFLLASR